MHTDLNLPRYECVNCVVLALWYYSEHPMVVVKLMLSGVECHK